MARLESNKSGEEQGGGAPRVGDFHDTMRSLKMRRDFHCSFQYVKSLEAVTHPHKSKVVQTANQLLLLDQSENGDYRTNHHLKIQQRDEYRENHS